MQQSDQKTKHFLPHCSRPTVIFAIPNNVTKSICKYCCPLKFENHGINNIIYFGLTPISRDVGLPRLSNQKGDFASPHCNGVRRPKPTLRRCETWQAHVSTRSAENMLNYTLYLVNYTLSIILTNTPLYFTYSKINLLPSEIREICDNLQSPDCQPNSKNTLSTPILSPANRYRMAGRLSPKRTASKVSSHRLEVVNAPR